MTHLNQVVLGSGMYFPPFNTVSKQKRKMHGVMKNRWKLKVSHYADHMVELNEKLNVFPLGKASFKRNR